MLSRRRFMLAAGAAVGCLSSGVFVLRQTSLRGFTRTSAALGTEVSITALHHDEAVAQAALDFAFAEIETVEAVMSIYREESEVCRLNRAGALDHPHPYLVEVLAYAAAIARETHGAFDVTVQPLWSLYAQARARGELPIEGRIAKAVELVDWRKLEVRPDRVRLRTEGMRITLNGIAQGFAADRAMAALESHGIEHALVDAGELAPLGRGHDRPWRAGIQHPRADNAYIALAKLDGRCLATSGDYATRLSDDGEFHHIFDPRSGHSPGELASATIAAPTAMAADALSTACFVIGPERAAELFERIPGMDALFVLKNGTVLRTAGFPIDA